MGKRLSQLNQIDQIKQQDYLLVDGEDYLESKKVKLKDINLSNFNTEDFYNKEQIKETFTTKESLSQELEKKQDKLISGQNIKTLNGESILGKGNITIRNTAGGGVGEETENNGEIFNDYENNIAGTKGFNIIGWDTTKNTYTLSSTEGLDTVAVGTQYSVIWDSNYINAGVITAVNGATVTVTTDYNINNESKNSLIVGDISTEEKVFFIVTRPDLGDISINEHQHAEGTNTQALLCSTHSEGYNTRAINKYSHTEGQDTIASGVASHAQNYHTAAKGNYSHAGGYQTIAEYPSQTVVGKFNNNKADTLYEVGNGTDEDHRSNALEVYEDGHATIQKQGETEDSVATRAYVDNQKDGVVSQIDNINNQIEDINNDIGNIETALESIIALQESLIGGNV